jgi:hypothetical protein
MGLRVAFVSAFLATDAQDVVCETVREFLDGRGHGESVPKVTNDGPSSTTGGATLDASETSLREG